MTDASNLGQSTSGQTPGSGPGSDSSVPTWLWVLLIMLVIAILGGIFVLLVTNRDQDEPEVVQDMYELVDGIDELNGHVATLNEQLVVLLAATEGVGGDAEMQVAAMAERLDELGGDFEQTTGDMAEILGDLEQEQELLRERLEEIEDSLPSEGPSPTTPDGPSPTAPEGPSPTSPGPGGS